MISATSSSLRPSVWRNRRAACSANGKQTCSPVTGAVQILRLSLRLLLICSARALVFARSLFPETDEDDNYGRGEEEVSERKVKEIGFCGFRGVAQGRGAAHKEAGCR